MVRKGAAYDECRNNLETLHHKSNILSPNVTRFFKIMFGDNFSKVLYLPPKFARTVRHLAGQETQLEDSSGHRWSVTCSTVNGSLALHKGWNKFFVDHGLKEGQLLVFHYINGSYFVVQIFGENACERTNFDNVGPRPSKRLKPNPDPVSPDELFQTVNVNSKDKPSSSDSVASRSEFQKCETHHQPQANANIETPHHPMSMDMDDPVCMISRRDDRCYQGEGRSILYDLSCFEMEKKTEQTNMKVDDTQMDVIRMNELDGHSNDVEKFEVTKRDSSSRTGNTEQSKVQGDHTKMAINGKNSSEICVEKFDKALDNKVASSHTVETEQNKMAVNDANQKINFIDKFEKASGTKFTQSGAAKIEESKTKERDAQMAKIISEKTNGSLTDKFHFKPSDSSNLSKKMHIDISYALKDGGSLSVGHSKIFERELAVKHKYPESSVSSSVLKNSLGQRAVKGERVEWIDEGRGFSEVYIEKKPMIVPEHELVFSPVVKAEPDLPYDIVPSDASSSFSAEVKSQLFLELPKHIPSAPGKKDRGRGKVIYLRDPSGRLWPMLYPDLFTAKALIGNWSRFCQENGIRPGDECRFQVENARLCFYRVDVTHGGGEYLE